MTFQAFLTLSFLFYQGGLPRPNRRVRLQEAARRSEEEGLRRALAQAHAGQHGRRRQDHPHVQARHRRDPRLEGVRLGATRSPILLNQFIPVTVEKKLSAFLEMILNHFFAVYCSHLQRFVENFHIDWLR